ncbi:MAG: hypothetical protein LDL41_04395 [Coleofasciculus sp. S288]|nr:hypothetical protein [Coleofasciculus sp. S288]
MKNGQCPKCGSRDVFSNTHRKFPAFHTIMLSSGNTSNRYASLDTYVCGSCGYVESYVAKREDLDYIKEEWASVELTCDRSAQHLSVNHLPSIPTDELKVEAN